ncbi:MAG: ABC transporter substrate-binding protein [Fervidicoccaceae archaeon]
MGNKEKAVSTSAVIAIVVVVILVAVAGIYLATRGGAPSTTTSPTTTATTPKTTSPTTQTNTTAYPSQIYIGLVEPLTGSYAVFGQEAQQAAQLIVDIINNQLGGIKSMGGAKLVLVTEDAGGTPESARLAAQKLISTYHVPIMLGAYVSRFTSAMAAVTEQNKVILMTDALVDSLTQQGWQYIFRVAPKASAHGKAAVDFVLDMAKKTNTTIKTAVVLNEDSIFGTTVANGAVLELVSNGIEISSHITYPYDISDVTPIINQIKQLNADILISIPYFNDGVLLAKAIQASGLKFAFIAGAGACGYTDPDSIKAAGNAVLYYTNTYSYNPARPTEWNQKVVTMFEQRYGKLPTEGAGIIFYSLMTVYEALEKAGKMFPSDPLNPDHLRAAFLSLDLNDTNSIAAQLYPSGHIKFGPDGDNLYPQTAILQVQLVGGNLTPVVVWPEAQPGFSAIFPRPGWAPTK